MTGDEAGVSLVLALVMLIVLSFIFLALANSSITDISNASNLRSQRSTEYAASGATAMAMQNVRHTYFVGTSLQPCLPSGVTTVAINGVTIEVDCQLTALNPQQSNTRVIDFYAFAPSSLAACSPAGAPTPACLGANALLTASVWFDDYSLTGQDSCSSTSTTTCGTTEEVTSWVLQPGNNPVSP